MALDASEETKYTDPTILSTLAAAYAETGDFDNATKYSSQAVEAAAQPANEIDDKAEWARIKEQLQKELDSYKQKKPTRELLTEDEAAKAKPTKAPDGDNNSPDAKKPDEKKPESEKKTDSPKKTEDKPGDANKADK